ncbi:MAG: DUF2059 domain-containing protein [Proteobacteria bacterium]|nr:DUF2059 domain-containing protein [Pseudomonadota bacterium]
MRKKSASQLIKFIIPTLWLLMGGISHGFAADPNSAQADEIGEDPGPVYTQVVMQWAKVTNFAQNAAQTIVGKFKIEIEDDPKIKHAFTPELKSDLEQFFYELFLSPETIKELAKLYAQYFTIDDMQDMIKFYQSPVGKKLIKAESELQVKTQQIGTILLKEHKNDYMRIIGKHVTAQGKK